jgi:Dolichyl-phosphate-mannose-protein mannosyltransferase
LFKTEKYFRHLVAAIIIAKLIIAYMLPITSDESYFYLWGRYPDISYYDHPPMTGWVMALFSLLGHRIFFDRLFAILSGLVIAWGIHRLVKDGFGAPQKARLITLAFLAAPLHVLSVLITTDTALILFTALAGFVFYNALQRRSALRMIWSGALWGLAILSKYFAGLLLFAVCACLLLRRERRGFRYLVMFLIGALPFVAFHLYGNYLNCWTNVLFNVVNRNKVVSWHAGGLLTFFLFQIYLATPWLLYYLARHRKAVVAGAASAANPFLYLFAVPLLLLAVVALRLTGLHWALAFYPFVFLLLVRLPEVHINRIVIFSLVFSLLHVVPVVTVLALPIETFKNFKYYHDLVLCKYGDQLYRKITAAYGTDYFPATDGYYTSGAMTYHSGRHFGVFLDYSKHGRQDDKLTDYKTLDGKNILVLATVPIDQDYTPYFDSLEQSTVSLHGQAFYVVIGKGFRYSVYRDRFLKKIDADWYTCPAWLPQGPCYFKAMYFAGQSTNSKRP